MPNLPKTTPLLAAAVIAATALVAPASAQTVAALTGDATLAIVDAPTRKVTRTVTVTGLDGRLVGIDVRPADGMLYGLTAGGAVVMIDTASGRATPKAKLDTTLGAGVAGTVDFNPVADRLRVIGEDGTNLRVNVDDGKVVKDGNLRFADTDKMTGKTPKVVAGAYTNAMKGAKETTLYDIEASGALLRQAPPNDGVLNTIGMLGMAAPAAAFDIVSDGMGGNDAWLMSGDTLYRIDLASGTSSALGKIAGLKGAVRDIAALPKM